MTDDLIRGVDLATAGEWDAAHKLCQAHEGDPTADWLHAVLHKIEGDLGNSGYWYRRAGRLDRVDAVPADELAELRALLAAR